MKKFLKNMGIPLFTLLLFVGCVSQTTATPQDEAQVCKVLQNYVAGRQARDLEAVEALLDVNVDQLTSRGEWRRGRDGVTAGMKRSSVQNPGDRTLVIESVRFLRPDVALVDARYIIDGIDAPDRVLWSSFTLVKEGKVGWQITSIRNQKPSE